MIGWEDGEKDWCPGRRSQTLNSHHDACDGGADQALISSDDFVNVAHWSICEHGRTRSGVRYASEPTTSTAATSGRPSGLHPTASHTGSLVSPLPWKLDPGPRGKGHPGHPGRRSSFLAHGNLNCARSRSRPKRPAYTEHTINGEANGQESKLVPHISPPFVATHPRTHYKFYARRSYEQHRFILTPVQIDLRIRCRRCRH